MEKKIVNPWTWQDNFGYAQAVEVKHNQGTLYCSGQTAMTADGKPAGGNMNDQILLSLQNLEKVIHQAGYKPAGVVRLNLYTTSIADFFGAYGVLAAWMQQHKIVPSSTLLEVKALAFPELLVEIEATVVG
ncbi:RidA family protein [Mucilaginibacter corticis]|uniref:RidA family protein n=1 Tax=Mucilaginibacter corticis TaxID=2597670 RepID=A0A556MRP6_9SPHI|nr:RidA family protein [Mucilaginibacter corticis]TSJ42621.1 RidA family protein [Mucilaginibacter corticis]